MGKTENSEITMLSHDVPNPLRLNTVFLESVGMYIKENYFLRFKSE